MKIILILLFLYSASGIKIECHYSTRWFWPEIDSYLYTCNVRSMSFADDRTIVTEVTGEHVSEKGNKDVGAIVFPVELCPRFHLKLIPKGLSNFFENVVALLFDDCSINSLTGNGLKEYSKLQWISIKQCDLQEIPRDFFAFTPNLTYVSFAFDEIRHVGLGLLDNLTQLKSANFSNNVCINKAASNPSELSKLKNNLKLNCAKSNLETSASNEP